MRVPKYRKHSSGQARVTINGKDHLLGKYGSSESKEAYGRLIAEFNASEQSPSFGKKRESFLMQDLLLAYIRHAKRYYAGSTEYANLVLAARPLTALYGSSPTSKFGPMEFRAVREWWLGKPEAKIAKDGKTKIEPKPRSRQYVNKQMKRTLRIIKWAVGEGMIPADNYTAIKCVEPLRKGRCEAREAKAVTCVDTALVNDTLKHLTPVVRDMVRFQQLTGCRPGEVCKIKPGMVDRSGEVWAIRLDDHKTAHRGKDRIIYCGPQAQRVLAPYLLRGAEAFCFSPKESEEHRLQAQEEARKTPPSHGNRRGSNRIARKPRKAPGDAYNAQSYGKSIKYACQRAKLPVWSPNQLRHNAATAIRKQFGLDAASVILGHSEVGVTQVYAEQDRTKAVEVAKLIG